MRIRIIVTFFLFSTFCFAQNSQLAYNYFRKGEFKKAAVIYKQLHEKNKIRRDYFKKLLSCYQLTEDFEKASNLLKQQIDNFPNQVHLNIELGYNFQLQNQKDIAIPYYDFALQSIEENANRGYLIGVTFNDNHLLNYALKTYLRSMELNPELHYDRYVASIYGEQAEIEKMFDAYLNMIAKNQSYFSTVQRYAGRFISDDSQDSNNQLLRAKIYWELGEIAVVQGDERSVMNAFLAASDLLDRTTSYGVGKRGETQYSWYLFYKNSIKEDLLPGAIMPVYSEGMVNGLTYLVNWYCSNQQEGLAANAMNMLDVVQYDMLEVESRIIDDCTK